MFLDINEFVVLFDPKSGRGLKYVYNASLIALLLTILSTIPASNLSDPFFIVSKLTTLSTFLWFLGLTITLSFLLIVIHKRKLGQDTVSLDELVNAVKMSVMASLAVMIILIVLEMLLLLVSNILNVDQQLTKFLYVVVTIATLLKTTEFMEQLDLQRAL